MCWLRTEVGTIMQFFALVYIQYNWPFTYPVTHYEFRATFEAAIALHAV